MTELLNYDATPYEHTLSVLAQTIEEKDARAVPRAFMDAVRGLSSLPYFCLFLSDLRQFNEQPLKRISSQIVKRMPPICGSRPALSALFKDEKAAIAERLREGLNQV